MSCHWPNRAAHQPFQQSFSSLSVNSTGSNTNSEGKEGGESLSFGEGGSDKDINQENSDIGSSSGTGGQCEPLMSLSFCRAKKNQSYEIITKLPDVFSSKQYLYVEMQKNELLDSPFPFLFLLCQWEKLDLQHDKMCFKIFLKYLIEYKA